MAILIPSELPDDAPKGERHTFKALSGLNDEWYVFSHVFWQSKRRGREGDGEIDFLLLHPRVGLVVVEVKGGKIDVLDGKWFSTGKDGTFEIKNPFEQATINKYALLKILQQNSQTGIPITHAVCFPDCSETYGVSTYGHRDIIWWTQDLDRIDAAIYKTVKHWAVKCQFDSKAINDIRSLIAPTATFRRRLVDDVGRVTEQLLRLTNEQYRVFESIQRNRRAVVWGGPGTGKTLLAIERARRLSNQGFKTLWTCYNDLLATHVQTQLEPLSNVTVRTFHSFCIREIRSANIALPNNMDETFWELRSPEMLLEAAVANGANFDAIIIDEGQDFSQNWIDVLEILTSQTQLSTAE